MMTLRALLVLFCLTTPQLALASTPEADARLGKTDFPTSGSAGAQAHFLRGLLNLHSFEYNDARQAFQKAREIEPGFAMAAWGEAMTQNFPIWLREDLAAGRQALDSLAPTAEERLALAPTEREKGYLRAVELLFGDGDKRQRDHAYRDAMAALAEQFPNDLDAAAFHALAILGTCHEGRDIPTYMQAASVAEEVFSKNPEHPGAAHYMIHSYDDPVHAPLGLRPARVYAEIAPAATHALHMPSHIFLALGLWEETAASNEDSWQASIDKVEREGLPVDRKSFHALLWLEYAYLQMGRHDEARKLLTIIEQDNRTSGSKHTRSYLATMRAHYLVETGRWHETIDVPELDDLELTSVATVLLMQGMAALHEGDIETATAHLADLRQRRQQVIADATEGQPTDGYAPSVKLRTLEAQIMELELGGLVHLARGEVDQGLEQLAQAAELEQDASFGFGPPTPAKPALELYGEALLDLGRAVEAREQLEKALARAPRRTHSLQALARATEALTDEDLTAHTPTTHHELGHRCDTASDATP